MAIVDPEKTWYLTDGEADIVKMHLVASYMADVDLCDVDDLVSFIEKPWNYFEQYKQAREWEKEGMPS